MGEVMFLPALLSLPATDELFAWQTTAATMAPEKATAFIRRRLKERARLQDRYATRSARRAARRPADVPPTSGMHDETLFSPLQPSQSPSPSETVSSLDTDAVRLFDEWFGEWFLNCAASGLHCDERLPESL